jgi:D-ribose pyranase
MKKIGILNEMLSSVIASMGHMDTLVVADAGLPIPSETRRIDLALSEGIPSFAETVRIVLSELQIESAVVAEEMLQASPDVYDSLREILGDVAIETVKHTEFKERTHSARAVVRTGEFTPYANVILVAGVVF